MGETGNSLLKNFDPWSSTSEWKLFPQSLCPQDHKNHLRCLRSLCPKVHHRGSLGASYHRSESRCKFLYIRRKCMGDKQFTHGSPKQGYDPCVEFDCTVMSLMEGARPLRFEGIIHRLVLLLYCILLDVQPAEWLVCSYSGTQDTELLFPKC